MNPLFGQELGKPPSEAACPQCGGRHLNDLGGLCLQRYKLQEILAMPRRQPGEPLPAMLAASRPINAIAGPGYEKDEWEELRGRFADLDMAAHQRIARE